MKSIIFGMYLKKAIDSWRYCKTMKEMALGIRNRNKPFGAFRKGFFFSFFFLLNVNYSIISIHSFFVVRFMAFLAIEEKGKRREVRTENIPPECQMLVEVSQTKKKGYPIIVGGFSFYHHFRLFFCE